MLSCILKWIVFYFFLCKLIYSNPNENLEHLEAELNSTHENVTESENKNNQMNQEKEIEDFEYAVIIDAGSTGSRVHVYRYKSHINNPLINVDFHNEKYQKFRPGLSSFENDPSNAGKSYLDPLLDFARQHVPLLYRTSTPVYLLASAGMRKIKERNEQAANDIIKVVYEYLKTSEFMIKSSWVRIIEGHDEGLWGWITANYLNGEIQRAINNNSVYSGNTKGVLEMGGESLQITFMPPKSFLKTAPNHALTPLTIGGVVFPVFTHSYMGIGMEAAQTKFDTYLATQVNERELSPCYLRGDIRERTTGHKVVWKGNGNFEECYNHLLNIIDKTECPKIEELMCTPKGIQMPHIKEKKNGDNNENLIANNSKLEFYYIENFYYTALILGIDHIDGVDFLKTLKTKGSEYCSLDKQSVQEMFPRAGPEQISKTCFCAAWLSVMLEAGFDLQDFTEYKVVRDIHGVGIDWALGFLVAQFQEIKDTHEIVRKFFNLPKDFNIIEIMEKQYKLSAFSTHGPINSHDLLINDFAIGMSEYKPQPTTTNDINIDMNINGNQEKEKQKNPSLSPSINPVATNSSSFFIDDNKLYDYLLNENINKLYDNDNICDKNENRNENEAR